MTGHSAGPSAAQVRESPKERDCQPEQQAPALREEGTAELLDGLARLGNYDLPFPTRSLPKLAGGSGGGRRTR